MITLEFFEQLVKKCDNSQEFVTKVREIKNVPLDISKEFYQKYGNNGALTPEKASEVFFNKFKTK